MYDTVYTICTICTYSTYIYTIYTIYTIYIVYYIYYMYLVCIHTYVHIGTTSETEAEYSGIFDVKLISYTSMMVDDIYTYSCFIFSGTS